MSILAADRFKTLVTGGFGHPSSTLVNAMAFFEGHVYVGTSAPSARSSEDRGRILRGDPVTGVWDTVYDSPVQKMSESIKSRAAGLTKAGGGGRRRKQTDVPDEMGREFGIRSMAVFKGKSDKKPCLYVATMSLWGGLILRSTDGTTFEPVMKPGVNDNTVMSFRGLTVAGDKLFVAAVGTITEDNIDRNLPPKALVYVSEDPASGDWHEANTPGFGDPVNLGIFSIETAHGHVYAATISPTRGCQLWRTEAKGKAPYKWDRVLTDGAFRFNFNLLVGAMTEFNGDLYVGTGLPGFGYDADNDVGPGAAELIRVHKDGSWDLIVGDPRFTPDGLKVPLAAMGPGFDNPYNSVFWAMCAHDGILYLGTHNWEPNAWAMDSNAKAIKGGYQLWASPDGETWTLVIDQANGNSMGCGIRTLVSTKHGLFVGTLNHTKLIKFQSSLRGGGDIVGDQPTGFDVLQGV